MIEEIKKEALNNRVPIVRDGALAYILGIIKERKVKDILELGTAVGYSSINMDLVDKDIRVDTLEKNEDMYNQALVNIEGEGLEDQIHVHFGPIEEFSTSKKYDLIFVDAAKAQYGKYTEQFLDNLKDDGIFVYDNMIFHGLVYDIENIKSKNTRSLVRKIVNFYQTMVNDERFDIIFLENVGDGLLLATRRKK